MTNGLFILVFIIILFGEAKFGLTIRNDVTILC